MGRRRGGTARQTTDGGRLDIECVYAVLNHPRRRLLLDVVADVEVATIRDLSTRIAALENEVAPHSVTDAQRREINVALYHVHVPKLAEMGVVEAEGGMERVRLGPNGEQVVAALEGVDAEADSRSRPAHLKK